MGRDAKKKNWDEICSESIKQMKTFGIMLEKFS